MIKRNLLIVCFLLFPLQMLLAGSQKPVALKYRSNSISDRDLSGSAARWLTGKGEMQLSSSVTKTPVSSAPVELQVLAIRVEFQKDNEATTTGDGKFDLSRANSLQIDPPPHNRTYFEAQLRALATYYRKVSNQKLILKGVLNDFGDVYPQEANRAYQLPRDMLYYGANETEEMRDTRLVQLFADAWTAADQSGEIDFAQYDCFVVFHAGVGGDFAFDFDESPYDVASAFLSRNDLNKYLGGNSTSYLGIPVQNGTFHIPDGMILPETQSQNELEFGLIGTAALMFGSQIGLPSLFDVETGRSGIGRWGLMDQGSGNYSGLIPAQPCAWSKVFMGWVEPVQVTRGAQLKVAAALAKQHPKIYKIPINAREYFLIENRQQRILKQPDVAIAYDQNGVRVELWRDGSITQSAQNDTFKVLVNVDEYDFDCPGSGILIWHIDESVIAANYATNRVNSNPARRGVDLEEAHGSQDIGGEYSFLHPASGSENGISENAFYNQNESNMTVNASEAVVFGPQTKPGSESNSRAKSHISISQFSKIDSIMSFSLSNDLAQPGFPQSIGRQTRFLKNSLVAVDLNADGIQELLGASPDGKIFCWNGDGSAFLKNDYIIIENDLLNRPDTLAVALFASVPDSIIQVPTVLDFGNGSRGVLAATKNNRVYAWKTVDENGDGFADLLNSFPLTLSALVSTTGLVDPAGSEPQVILGLNSGSVIAITARGMSWETNLSSSAITGLAYLPATAAVVATTQSGELALVTTSGQVIWKIQAVEVPAGQPVVGDLNADGNPELVIPFADGKIRIFNSDESLHAEASVVGLQQAPELVLADLNGDGLLEILTVAQDRLFALNYTGSSFENFPVELVWQATKSTFQYGAPVVMNLDDETNPEILVGIENGDVLAFHANGEPVDGFPLTTAGAHLSSLQIARLDADKDFEIAAITEDHSIYVWDWPTANAIPQNSWTGFLANANHWAFAQSDGQTPGDSGSLISLAYNYPNPTEGAATTIRYELAGAADVQIRIFDIAGECVAEFRGTGMVRIPNEVIWSLDAVQSGIYLAKIVANSEELNKTEFRFIKIAVVK